MTNYMTDYMADYLYITMDADCGLFMVQNHAHPDGSRTACSGNIGRGKGFSYVELSDEDGQPTPLRLDSFGLLIPCDRTVTAAIRDFLDAQKMITGNSAHSADCFGPYYFTQDMTGNEDFETTGTAPRLMGGPHDTAYAQHIKPAQSLKERFKFVLRYSDTLDAPGNPENLPFARYNCWTACQGIAQYIGGIDLSAIHPEFSDAWRLARAVKALTTLGYDIDRGKNADYTTVMNDQDMMVSQRRGGPPFILLRPGQLQNDTLSGLLSRRLAKDDETLGSWIDRQKIFTRVPTAAHLHKTHPGLQPD